jgi:uncharacterized membrane protein
MTPEVNPEAAEREVEIGIAQILRGGVVLSTIVLVAGVVLEMAAGHPPFATRAGLMLSVTAIWSGVLTGDSMALISAGILLLIATPWVRVILSLGLFLRMRDTTYFFVCLIVLGTMIVGLMVGAR